MKVALHDKRFHDEDDIAGSVPDAIPIEVDLGFHSGFQLDRLK